MNSGHGYVQMCCSPFWYFVVWWWWSNGANSPNIFNNYRLSKTGVHQHVLNIDICMPYTHFENKNKQSILLTIDMCHEKSTQIIT